MNLLRNLRCLQPRLVNYKCYNVLPVVPGKFNTCSSSEHNQRLVLSYSTQSSQGTSVVTKNGDFPLQQVATRESIDNRIVSAIKPYIMLARADKPIGQ